MLYWGLNFQKPTTMSNSLSSQESCTRKQVNEAQSINQLVEKKTDYNNSSQVSNINGNFPELDRIELMSEMERLTKLEKIRKIARSRAIFCFAFFLLSRGFWQLFQSLGFLRPLSFLFPKVFCREPPKTLLQYLLF
jgi:hypothetical protein